MKRASSLALLACVALAGCSTIPARAPAAAPGIAAFEARDSQPLAESLFASDTGVLSNEAVDSILRSAISVKSGSVIAVLKIPGSRSIQKYYGYNYWTSEKYLDTQERLNKSLKESVKSGKIAKIEYMPSLIVPRSLSIPLIREAGARLQADLVLVFGEQSNIFNEYRLFQSMRIRAYASCEYVLLDTRTGVILASDVITEKIDTEKKKEDTSNDEACLRAETEALDAALRKMGRSIGEFIDAN